VNGFGSGYWSLLVASVEFLIVVTVEVNLALGLRRRPVSRLVTVIVRDFYGRAPRRRNDAVLWATFLVAFQFFPLNQERLFGGTFPPDHITGAAVILAELLFGAYLWRGTRPDGPLS